MDGVPEQYERISACDFVGRLDRYDRLWFDGQLWIDAVGVLDLHTAGGVYADHNGDSGGISDVYRQCGGWVAERKPDRCGDVECAGGGVFAYEH